MQLKLFMDRHSISERTACSLVGLSRAANYYILLPRDDEELLRAEVFRMASMVIALLSAWCVTLAGGKKVWRSHKSSLLEAGSGSSIAVTWLRATYPNHVWSYDFVFIRDAYGGKISMLAMIDEFSRKYLMIHCARRIGSIQVIEQLANAIILNGIPKYIHSDNGPEFIDKELHSWLSGIVVKTIYIEPGSP
jgi:putative transposase